MRIITIVRVPLLLIPVIFITYWLIKAAIAVVKYFCIFLRWMLDKMWLGTKKSMPYVKSGAVLFGNKCVGALSNLMS